MRIALVAPFGLRARGTTRARVMPLAHALARRGHGVAVFIPPYDSPEDSGRSWREADGPVDVVNVALPRAGVGSGAWHLWVAWRLWRAVVGWRPDVVHVFKPKGPSGLVGAGIWLGRRAGRPFSASRPAGSPVLVVDSDDWEGPGGWNDDPRTGYSALQRRFFAWQERFGLAHADAWTVTSDCLRGRAMAFGAAAGRVFVLHNGISVDLPEEAGNRPHEGGVSRREGAVLLYTRFAGVRPADVAAIWAEVRGRVPWARLVVAGRGLAGEEQQLAGLPGVEVCGWVERTQLVRLLGEVALAIVPWADTPSNRARHSAKVLELMAAGVPIVAYAVGELPTTLGEAGLLVPPGDAQAFARAVADLLADPQAARRLGLAAQARVRERFSWEGLAEVALAAYMAGEANEKTAR